MGRRSDQRSEGAAGTGQGSATQEVLWATVCCTKVTHRGGPKRGALLDAEAVGTGGVWRAVIWNRAALPDALGWRGYSAWCRDGRDSRQRPVEYIRL